MFALAWGDGDEALVGVVDRAQPRVVGVQMWRGAREPQRWIYRTDTGFAALDGGVWRMFEPLGAWGDDPSGADAPIANFVVRVVATDAREDILRQLLEQADAGEGVLAQPGCAGLSLAAAAGQPEAMLGITHWPTLDAFDAYATWAQSAPWKDVIGPVTVEVPLRLLARRCNIPEGSDDG